MAGRNRNTFVKRQKEMERLHKAREKMARRHGKRAGEAGRDADGPPPEAELSCAIVPEGVNGPNPEGAV